MAGKGRRKPDVELRSRTRFDEPQRLRVYVYERYAIIHKVMLSRSDAFTSFAVKARKFVFHGEACHYFRMSMVIGKEEFLSLKQTLVRMDPLTGLSALWFDLEPEKTNKSGE